MGSRATPKRGIKGRSVGGSTGGGGKRARKQDYALEDDIGEKEDMFAQSDSDAAGEDSDSGDESDLETAQEKKLRVAKAYLQQLREAEARQAGSGSEDDATTNDAVAERLRGDAMEAIGHVQRQVALSLAIPALDADNNSGSFYKCHRFPATAVALTADETTVYSVSKGGSIVATDVETGACQRFSAEGVAMKGAQSEGGRAEWIAKAAIRGGGPASLLAAAVSSDGRYLAVGGGSKVVHIWDARSQQHVQGFPQHRDIITGLAFREGTHELFSGSFDRTVKLWSLDDRAYIDTLFGHQSEVVALDVLRQERILTSGQDRTCRVWKVPEESQLIFRGYGQAIDCVAYVTGTEWVSGGSDGGVSLWSQMKKKPISVQRNAHTPPSAAPPAAARTSTHDAHSSGASPPTGPGSVGGDCASWVSSVACARGTDLVASGAGDGVIRLWQVAGEKGAAGRRSLKPLGGLPARGFVNGLQLGRSGQVVVAAIGQEPRLGRWSRDRKAKNGLLIHRIPLSN